jgi:N-acetylneuraminic acid mutarotase
MKQLILGFALAAFVSEAAAQGDGRAGKAPGDLLEWSTGPSLLHARAAHTVVATSNAIYALAGSGEGMRPVMEVERFDGNTWTLETTVPEGLNAPAAAVVGDRIFVIGGFSGVSNLPTDRVHIYDTRSKQWSLAAPLPAPRGGHAAVVLNGKIHVFGGGNNRSTIADHSVYDPSTNAWTERAPLPRSEGSPAGVVFNGSIWAIGGRSGPNDFGDVYIYDAAADRWNSGPAIEPRGTAGAVVFAGTIFVLGGESQAQGATLRSVLQLAPNRATWQQAPPMPTARNYARAVVLKNAIWTIGGSPAAGASHSSAGSRIVERLGR